MNNIEEQLLEQVKEAVASKQSLDIRGHSTKQHLGRSQRSDNILNLAKHTGIVEYKPVELVMTARAGTTLAEINHALDKHQQMLACDPIQYNGQASIGGSLASHQSGHAHPWLGSLRDHTLGIKLINGKAEHIQFGGQVMKNVAGYDVSRLQAGAMGTLGVLTEVSFKVLPKPAAEDYLCLHIEAQAAIELMSTLSRSSKPVTALSWHKNKIYIRLQGTQRAVESTSTQWQKTYGFSAMESKVAKQYWHELREHQLDFFNHDQPLWLFSTNSQSQHTLKEQDWLINWAGAQRWLSGDYEFDEIQTIANSMQADVRLYKGGNRAADIHQINNSALKTLIIKLKHALDPEGIFNPGRLYSWL